MDDTTKKMADLLGIEIVEPMQADGPIHYTHLGNARRMVREHGNDIRHCPSMPSGGWLLWDDQRWKLDQTGQIMRLAKDRAGDLYREAAALDQDARDTDSKSEAKQLQARAEAARKWARTSESANVLRATIELLRTESSVPITIADVDADPWLMGTPGGTVDLRTGKVRTAERTDLITKSTVAAWDDDATCPTWDRFLLDVMGGDQELVEYLQRAIGYSLVGVTSAQAFFVLHGTGANGKSTFVETLRHIFGDYARNCPAESFVGRKEGGISNDIARLAGARFATASETAEGKPLDEAMVKAVTGGEPITTRFLRKEFFEFTPRFTLWLSTNHKPRVKGTDNGIWRRIRLIPFAVTIAEEDRDPELPAKLRAEASGILRWAVQGAVSWARDGLQDPPTVLDATMAYRTEQDVVAAFLEDCVEMGPGHAVVNTHLYQAYRDWCADTGEYLHSQRWLTMRLKSQGYVQTRSSVRMWQGMALLRPVSVGRSG